ncbi:MAG: hypothetical protein JSV88_05550 [Candidatus Aminicenantes bacterium]|nr:MAG: hypothetical protein JSV88_05550 [Candidatus Aminicenantes bacterium]
MKNKKFLRYTSRVLSYIQCNAKTRKLIREDLYTNLSIKSDESGEDDPIKLMGDPREVAREFISNLDLKESGGFEYQTNTKLFGIPILHINLKPSGITKGIIAIGNIAIGFIAIGRISIGVFSCGAISVGILASLGAVSLALLLSIGAVAISYGFSLGAVAIATHFAIGAVAVANIALGDVSDGIVSIYRSSGSGEIMIKIPADKETIKEAILKIYPNIHEYILQIFLRCSA